LPDWYVNAPEIRETNRIYLQAFWELSTERRFQGGPIPWSQIRLYARENGVADELLPLFEHIVRELDEEFVAYVKS